MTRQFDYGEEAILEFLRDTNSNRDGSAGDLIHPDRGTVCIRAVNYTLRALELDKPATWLQGSDFTRFDLEGFEGSGDQLDKDINADVTTFLASSGPVFEKLLISCDKTVGLLLLSSDNAILSAHTSSTALDGSEQITKKHGDVQVSYSAKNESTLRLFQSLIELTPRCLHSGANFPAISNLLCRATFSADPQICEAAVQAMERVAKDPAHCLLLVENYRGFIFESRHIFRDTFIGARLLESQFERIIKLWLSLLQSLVAHQRLKSAQADKDDQEFGSSDITPTMIEKIEGCGLFLLCSGSMALRKLAEPVLAAARDMEGPVRRPSAAFRYSRINPETEVLSRVIQLYEGTVSESDIESIRSLPWLSATDKHRLEIHSKDRVNLIPRIAGSDHPKDGSLWLALLPILVLRLEQLPGALQEARSIICQAVIRLQGHIAVVGTGKSTNPASRVTSDLTALAEQWRAYFSVLCVSSSSITSIPTSPPVQRISDTVILNFETIRTPQSLFTYLSALLSWEDGRFRDAAVYALGTIRQDLLRPLSEMLLANIRRLADGAKNKLVPRRVSNEALWTAHAHVFRLISPLLLEAKSPANLSSMIGFVKLTLILLSDKHVREDYDLQSLRRYFCHVVENLCNSLGKLEGSDRFLGDDTRGAIFKLCYDWCHVGRRPDIAKARESQALQSANESFKDRGGDRAQYLSDLQAKTKLLSAAAAEAMAGLCVCILA